MAKKTKSKKTAPATKQEQHIVQTKSATSTNGKNMGFRFVQGALMRAPFLLLGTLILYWLKQNEYISSGADSSTGSAGSGFPLSQVLVVNIASEACVKVWWMFLRENETGTKA
ncbi:hypothetical protein CERZMDRAFT_95811 [Cercospora zeae-maydis SCOH1-5]|uniref:Uncharacterized protein n=1 Tax=Cercospora zeae-maydis SCOH1-5 TaxID=717836 RepID=A0A6A6FM76_9PEZI|nr:hypothetical protein CERZMDRAFT_95811 [Cercospora zeae-maydis SCOH1-5]